MNTIQLQNIEKINDEYCPRHNKQLPEAGAAYVVIETDGAMVPIVNFKKSVAGDKRKLRELCYKEARLALAYPLGSVSPTYCASINDVNSIGKNLRWCASVAGLSKTTYTHGVGDGAEWIANQVKVKFGDVKNNYLIDMYHLDFGIFYLSKKYNLS